MDQPLITRFLFRLFAGSDFGSRTFLRKYSMMNNFVLISILLLAGGLSWPLGKMLFWAMEPTAHTGLWRNRLNTIPRFLLGSFFEKQQNWKEYGSSLLFLNFLFFLVAFCILYFQSSLPLNPDGKGPISLSLLFHTVASFTSNTNLQHYSGEVVLSYFSQIFGLMWLQFVSAATGIAALTALARGLSGKILLGNFYQDIWNATFLVLLPLALVFAILLVLGGVPMTWEGSAEAITLEGQTQWISRGPVASFVAIKQLGTNGGGFFGPNSTHPFENPTLWTNFLETLAILLIPMAAVWMFGFIIKNRKHATVLFAVMAFLLLAKIFCAVYFDRFPNVALQNLSVTAPTNLEGKELRFGTNAGPVWAALTTSTSNGSVNSMHNSLHPLAALAPLVGMWLNTTFGGVGVGLINLLVYVFVGVFICGMMVGRTPEYLTRKVETYEMKLALLVLLLHPFFILGGTALFVLLPWGTETICNPGSRGFTEILYEMSSAAANNGSGFEGLGDNTPPWNWVTGFIMLFARYLPILLPLAIAGSLATKKPAPETTGTLRTDTWLFGLILLGNLLFIGALLFLPVAVVGPIAEYLQSISPS